MTSNTVELCRLPVIEIQDYTNGCANIFPHINVLENFFELRRAGGKATNSRDCDESRLEAFMEKLKQRYHNMVNSNVWKRFFGNQNQLERISKFLGTREWQTAPIRCMAWHPQVHKMAIANSEDVIRTHNGYLKHRSQKNITCMAWRPWAVDELAVGCSMGVMYWVADPNKERLMRHVLLKSVGHKPVTSIAFRGDGLFLASCSINDSRVLLWDIDRGTFSLIRQFRPKCSSLLCSPTSWTLMCSTIGKEFHMWHENSFTVESWGLQSGRIQSAAWSPCGEILLFVTADEMKLYQFQKVCGSVFQHVQRKWIASPLADLSPLNMDHSMVIGGLPQAIAWDPTGTFLAITFKETDFVAIFLTQNFGEGLNIYPHGYVARPDEYPISMCFLNMCRMDRNAILNIGWSKGYIQFCCLKNI